MSTALSVSNDLLKKGSETKGFDPRNLSKNTIRMLIVGALVTVGLYWALPYLNTIVWGMVELAEGALVLAIVGIILWTIWSQLGNICTILSKTLLGWLIEYDPWALQYKQIDNAEEDLEKMLAESAKVHAVLADNIKGVEAATTAYEVAVEAEAISRQELQRTDLSPDRKSVV